MLCRTIAVQTSAQRSLFAGEVQKHVDVLPQCRGAASNGELGYGEKGKKSSANPDKCPVLDGVPTEQVACGTGFSLFLVDPDHEAVKKLPEHEAAEDSDDAPNADAEPAAKGQQHCRLSRTLAPCFYVAIKGCVCPHIGHLYKGPYTKPDVSS